MVCFQTKNPNLGKFFQGLGLENVDVCYGHLEHLGYFMTIWYIVCSFGTVFPVLGIMHQEKSGNPGYTNFYICCLEDGIFDNLSAHLCCC
jgi:hypothetical protein